MHNIIMEGRKILNISGVTDCKSFEDNLAVLLTEQGELTVKGEGLIMESFSNETGDFKMQGNIMALGYTNENKPKSLLSRVFK